MGMKIRGDSGSDVSQSMDDKITTVGISPNLYPSCRLDGAGRKKEVVKASSTQGVLLSESSRTEYEAIDNSGDHHGGTYSIIAMNKFTVDAAGGGISLSSGGNINLMAAGGLTNIIATEAVSIVAKSLIFTGSEISAFEGPELYINTDNTTFVNNVRLSKNLIVNGGALINGELYVNSITAPHQIMDTSSTNVLPVFFNTPTVLTGIGSLVSITPPVPTEGGPAMAPSPMVQISFVLDPVTTSMSQGFIRPHYHTYRHAAVNFKECVTDVWSDAEPINKNEAVEAKPSESFGGKIQKIVTKNLKRVLNEYLDAITQSIGL